MRGVFVALLAAAACASAAEDHLLPINPELGTPVTRYRRIVERRLCITPADCARALVLPSQGGESSVSIYSHASSASGEQTYTITLLKAERNIWYQQMYQGYPSMQHDPLARLGAIKVSRIDAPFPSDCAAAVHRAWAVMLDHVAPLGPPSSGGERVFLDGTEIEFSFIDHGRTRAGSSAPVLSGRRISALLQLAQRLESYCEARSLSRDLIARDILSRANRLTSLASR